MNATTKKNYLIPSYFTMKNYVTVVIILAILQAGILYFGLYTIIFFPIISFGAFLSGLLLGPIGGFISSGISALLIFWASLNTLSQWNVEFFIWIMVLNPPFAALLCGLSSIIPKNPKQYHELLGVIISSIMWLILPLSFSPDFFSFLFSLEVLMVLLASFLISGVVAIMSARILRVKLLRTQMLEKQRVEPSTVEHEISTPPESRTEISTPPVQEKESEIPEVREVTALRGGEVVGGKFEFKIKIKNDTEFVVFNVNVTIIGYPEDCLELTGPTTKKITRIEPTGFRSPQFTFTPTKDCVEGQVSSTVSYLDHLNQTQILKVEPYIIRSVCDLLTPLETSLEEFDLMLNDMSATSEKTTFEWNPEVLYQKAKSLLTAKNFYIIEAKKETIAGEFHGTIRGLAEGKYTGKRVALRVAISGPADGTQANVEVEGLGEDIAMLPTTIDEISKGIDSWTCMNCGGALDSNEVTKIKSGENVECRYCRHIMTIDLYRR